MFKLAGLDHVGITVTDLEKSIRFYQSLGMQLLRTGGPDDKGVRSAVVRAGGQELNLFCVPGLVTLEQENLAGMHHFCLRADAASAEELIADLRAVGLEIFRGPVQRRDGVSVFVHDPDRVRVELLIPLPAAIDTHGETEK